MSWQKKPTKKGRAKGKKADSDEWKEMRKKKQKLNEDQKEEKAAR